MTNAEKEQAFATARALDRIAIPLWLAGANLDQAYREAMKTIKSVPKTEHDSGV